MSVLDRVRPSAKDFPCSPLPLSRFPREPFLGELEDSIGSPSFKLSHNRLGRCFTVMHESSMNSVVCDGDISRLIGACPISRASLLSTAGSLSLILGEFWTL